MDYEAEDKAVLVKVLLALHTCPHCRCELAPVGPMLEHVWGCDGKRGLQEHPPETWYLPTEEK